MSRPWRMAGMAAIVISALALYGSLERSARGVTADPAVLLDALRRALADSGMHRRHDVSIEMNGRDVALGFSRPGCNGLMLVAVLPHTAQGWAHMAPRLDLSRYRLSYLYNGARYPAVPRLERLAGRLRGDLALHEPGPAPQVVAVAEYGHCGLVPGVAAALEAVSRGRSTPAGRAGFQLSMRDTSI